jgi:hypothetical protein
MRLNRLALVLAASMALVGCDEAIKISEKRITVEVVSVRVSSKSNSKVTLREIPFGYIWKEQRLSCSSTKARNVKIGKKWELVEARYEYRESKEQFSRLLGVPGICTQSNY